MIKNNIRMEEQTKTLWRLASELRSFPIDNIGQALIALLFLRRMDCLLKPYYEQIHNAFAHSMVDDLYAFKLTKGLTFYNYSGVSLDELLINETGFTDRFDQWLNGFDEDTKKILNGLGFNWNLSIMKQNRAFYKLLKNICQLNLTEPLDVTPIQELFISGHSRRTGQYFSPKEYGEIIAALLFREDDFIEDASIFDPVCGSSLMLYGVAQAGLKKNIFKKFECFGNDLDMGSVALSKALKLVLDLDNLHVQVANSLVKESFGGRKFNYIVADLPLGGRLSEHDIKDMSVNEAYVNGLSSKVNPDMYFMQMIIHRLTDSGKAAVITAGGSLFNMQSVDVRSWLFSMDYVDAIVRIPKLKSAFTGIDQFVWILNKNKAQEKKPMVRLIDLQLMEKYVLSHTIIPDEILFELEVNENKDFFSKLIPTSDFATYNVTLQNRHYGGTVKTTISNSTKGLNELLNQGYDISENGPWSVLYEKTTVNYTVNFNAYFAQTLEKKNSANKLHSDLKNSLYYVSKSMREIEAMEMPERANLDNDLATQKSQWAGIIPTNWKHLALQNIFECKIATRESLEPGRSALITLKSLRSEETTNFVEPTDKSVKVNNDDILIVRVGQNAGEVFRGKEGVLGNMIYRMRILDSSNYFVDKDFSFYMLQAMSKYLSTLTQGTSVPILSAKAINSTICYLPSMEEQQRIVKFLRPIVNRIDRIHEDLGVVVPSLKEFREALIFDAVTGKLNL